MAHYGTTYESDGKRKPVYFPSKPHQMEAYPCNAVTGMQYRHKIGTLASKELYKVVDSTGQMNRNGYRISKREPRNPNPNHLYYDDPQQFSNHSGIWVDPLFVKQWLKEHRSTEQEQEQE